MGVFQILFNAVFLLEAFYQTVSGKEILNSKDEYTYIEETHSSYKFYTKRSTWQDAVSTCAKEGATLFYPLNQCEADVVVARWSQTPSYGWAFIGISNLNKTAFETIDGRSIFDVYNNWRIGEPNNANGNENCVVFLRDGTLNDVQCDRSYPFICKKNKDSSYKESLCDRTHHFNNTGLEIRSNYVYLNTTQRYYKVHTVFRNWNDAKKKCEDEGAVLFYPKKKCEVDAVLEMWNEIQPFGELLVGISDAQTGLYQTVDGQALWEVYKTWDFDEPNNPNKTFGCVVIQQNGVYSSADCEVKRPFICKMVSDDVQGGKPVCDTRKTVASPQQSFMRDYVYLEDTQQYYKVHKSYRNLNEAQEICKKEDSVLFYPQNECEMNTVLKYWDKTHTMNHIIIGLYSNSAATEVKSNYVSTDGRPIRNIYNKWNRGEPKHIETDKACVTLSKDGILNAIKCDIAGPFMCKKVTNDINAACYIPEELPRTYTIPPIDDDIDHPDLYCCRSANPPCDSQKPPPLRPTCPVNQNYAMRNFKYIKNTQSFYQFHGTFKTWAEARKICERESAYLYYPENKCEADLVQDFWNQELPANRIHVGITSFNRGLFDTIHGLSAGKVYSKWRLGEPNDYRGLERCVVMHRNDSAYSDERCDLKLPFICKLKNTRRKKPFGCTKVNKDLLADKIFRYDYKYFEDTDSVYKIHTITNEWQRAKLYCISEGATLFYPESECELNVVRDYWNEAVPSSINEVFLGISKTGETEFESVDGTQNIQSLYLNWAAGKPSNISGEEQCVKLDRDNGTYSDVDCNLSFNFICKRMLNSGSKDYSCSKSSDKPGQNVSNNYVLLNATQRFYRIHTKPRNWENANRVCAKEGATLFYPTSRCEAAAVMGLWSQNKVFGSMLIGASRNTEEDFVTIDSEPLSTIYNNWRPGEPNNAQGNENCVVLSLDETLSDVNCNKSYPYICRKDPVLGKPKAGVICDLFEKAEKNVSDYSLLSDTQSFYKLHTIQQTWRRAVEICANESAILFYPENNCEANSILEFWNQTQVQSQNIFVGISYIDGSFKTVDGQLAWDVYSHWKINGPLGQTQCAQFTQDATLVLTSCDNPHPFICKKKNGPDTIVGNCDKTKKDELLATSSEYFYLNETQNSYKFYSQAVNWQEANNYCTKEGAKLFYPNSILEVKSLLDLWSQKQTYGWIYVGVSSPTEGIFETIDHKPILDVYNKWHTGEPNNLDGDEGCVVLFRDGTLSDINCNKRFPFICRKDSNSHNGEIIKVPSENDVDPKRRFRKDYNYFNQTQSFYKIHTLQQSWENAKKICADEGAALYYPENNCEANVVTEFWNLTQFFDSVFIGISRGRGGFLETVNGQPIWKVPYNKWLISEPSNINGNENCVALTSDGAFMDVNCNIKLPFICRKKSRLELELAQCDIPDRSLEINLNFRMDYTYIQDSKTFYKIHTILKNWNDAKKTCEAEGTRLFYAENGDEARIVQNFWRRTQTFDSIYVGAWNHNKNVSTDLANFLTIDGRLVKDIRNGWQFGEPPKDIGREQCGVLTRERLFYADRCDYSKSFICVLSFDSLITRTVSGKQITNEKTNETSRKDYTYLEETRSFYKLHEESVNWKSAQQTCIDEGAELFYPENNCEATAIAKFWSKTPEVLQVFIGVSKLTCEVFETIHGAPMWLVYNNWIPGEPNNADEKENCVVLYSNGTLNDEACELNRPFICKKKGDSKEKSVCSRLEINETRVLQKDYTFVEETQSLYKIHTTFQNWHDARKTCRNEGAALFYAENECEVKAVVKFWKKNQPLDWIFLGISNSKARKFKTIDGRDSWNVYNKWRPSQPNNTDNQENCVVLYGKDLLLDDDLCLKKGPFICKKEQYPVKKRTACDTAQFAKRIAVHFQDYTFDDVTQNGYKIHTIFQNWKNAQKVCSDEGAVLFYPENEKEYKSVQSFWAKTQRYDQVFVGLTFTEEGGLKTLDGKNYKNFNNLPASYAQVDMTDDEKCVLLSHQGNFIFESCTKTYPFICKKTLKMLGWNVFCDTADLGYKYNKALGKCYKYNVTPLNWMEAYAACVAEQSYLAVLNSQEEQLYLDKLAAETPKENIQGNVLWGANHIGYHNQNLTGWRTITGQTLTEAGFDAWSPNEPNGGDAERCGSKFDWGKLNDISCETHMFSICERDIDFSTGDVLYVKTSPI